MNTKFKVELTKSERKDNCDVLAITFSICKGYVIIREHWEYTDELWSDGVTIAIPQRIWKLGMEWLAAQ